MNKLEEIHKQATVSESAEITTDVAIKFAKWIDDSSFTYYDEEDIWSSIATEEKKTSEELFEEFINIYYGK
jgi:plasmid maintenance system antidote protein VapI